MENIYKYMKKIKEKHRYPDGVWMVQPFIHNLIKIIDYNIKNDTNVTINLVTEKEENKIGYGIYALGTLIIYKIEDI